MMNDAMPDETPDTDTSGPAPAANQLLSVTDGGDSEAAHLLPYPVVAIGGSAGGIEAYVEILENLPHDTGIAFIILSHLAAGQKSHLVEILASKTGMPVSEIRDNIVPEPNHIYVLTPDMLATIAKGRLRLEPKPEGKTVMVIDHFFRSLAADQKNRAVGVVLSGMDSDGALGLKAIKGEGGIAIVQSPESALFPGMPHSSIEADHVDLVIPPDQIGTELARIAWQFSRPEVQSLDSGRVGVEDEQVFARILTLLTGVAGIDFRQYRPATLQRRIARRMTLRRIDKLSAYFRLLQNRPDELRELHEDVLIGVTRFFRDPDMFEILKSEVLPRILESAGTEQPVRIWVAGCSTGEEAYSIAICLLEYLSNSSFVPLIQIFGTDASDRAIEKARLGTYPENIATDVSPERLWRFFTKAGKSYQVAKRIRDMCIFARQNLCIDPPFGNIDLVSCRNVLIYLNQELQNRIVATFHYAIRPGGFLLLGSSETIRGFSDAFALTERKWKIYTRLAGTSRHLAERRVLPPIQAPKHVPPPFPSALTEIDLQRAADRIVLARYTPPGFIVNEKMEIIQSRGHTGMLLGMAPGTSSLHLLRMLHESIASQVHEALQRAMKNDVPIHVDGLQLRDNGQTRQVALDILPIHGAGPRGHYFLVMFPADQGEIERAALPATLPADASEKDRIIYQLQADLASTKIYLQSLIEERDARNQELITANEEIQSANEELQSSNEELETTKEEVQSANEELRTVNEELQQRNAILAQTSNDLLNLLNSVNLPVLMLNNDLQIRQFTALAQRLLQIRPGDVGRPLREIRLGISLDDLEPVLRDVLETLATREIEVQDREGCWRLLRVRPYRTADNRIEGVVMILLDINELRRSQQELRAARDFVRAAIEHIRVPLVILNTDLKIRTTNTAFRELCGLQMSEIEGRSFADLVELLWEMRSIRPALEKLAENPEPDTFELRHEFVRDAAPRIFSVWARNVAVDSGHVLVITIEDISAQVNAERSLAELNRELAGQVHSAQEWLGRTQTELRRLAGSLFQSQEDERRRVARELHDDISQQLALLEMSLVQLEQEAPSDPEEIRRQTAKLREQTGKLSDDIRSISHRLHPSVLEHLGLPAALKALVEEFEEREEMPATFVRRSVPETIPMEVAGVLYRITQEALRNVAKHAGRTHVKVILEGTAAGIKLQVTDLGEGFNPEDARNAGLGLISMAERARLVNGSFHIDSAIGVGTTVTVEVPLPSPQM